MIRINKNQLIVVIILLLAGFLRFYNLMRDAPYFFNPDERNMANAIAQFRLPAKISEISSCLTSQFSPHLYPKPFRMNPQGESYFLDPNSCNLNPHFFAYGQFPLYLAFFSDQIIRLPNVVISSYLKSNIQYLTSSFSSAIFWLRFWSALTSTLTVLLVYAISKEILPYLSFRAQSRNLSQIQDFFRLTKRSLHVGRDDTIYYSLLAAFMAAFTPGLIQAAHFGTTESLLTFFFLASIYLSFKLVNTPAKDWFISSGKYLILLSIVLGLALGTKLTGLFFFAPPFLALTIQTVRNLPIKRKKRLIGLLSACRRGRAYWLPAGEAGLIGLFLILGSLFFFLLSSPYNLVDPQNFKSAVFGYESDVATGRFEAFYTRQFVDTIPIIFQIEKVFPYALGIPLSILGFLGFLTIMIDLGSKLLGNFQFSIFNFLSKFKSKIFKFNKNYKLQITNYSNNKEQSKRQFLFIFITSFLIYFIPNAFLFAKWTRFMTPILPFFAIFAGYLLFHLYQFLLTHVVKAQSSKLKAQSYSVKLKRYKFLILILIFALCTLSLLPGAAFMSIYAHQDSRMTASKWIYQNIPDNSYVLSETANVVDIPLGIPNYPLDPRKYNLTVISFDFYHLDENPKIYDQLLTHLEKADYIFIPSRRIFANYMRLPKKYPLVTKYYQLLFSGRLGFEKVTEISSFPGLGIGPPAGGWNLKFDDEQSEETFTVFDHPVVRIYKKVKNNNKENYSRLFAPPI